jgi:hypothetical protein
MNTVHNITGLGAVHQGAGPRYSPRRTKRTKLTNRGRGAFVAIAVAAIATVSWAVQHPHAGEAPTAPTAPAMDNDPAPIEWTCPQGWEFQASTFTCELSATN